MDLIGFYPTPYHADKYGIGSNTAGQPLIIIIT
jgi:hypothetical protein